MKDRQDHLSINIFEQINLICKEFRRVSKSGERPRIEVWLKRVDEDARSTLFSNLLQTELRIREKNGERPSSAEYIKRFEQFASLIRHAFDESTMGSMELGSSTPRDSVGDNVTRTFEIPAANLLGDYELLGELGRGGFGVVYKARHLKRQNLVALKTLPTGVDGQELNADRLHKFRKEFRSLSEINHPNLVGMQTLEVDGSQWFFTMDLIEGGDFLSYVRPNDELDESRLRSALKQFVKGIIALHERNIIHRDLKPGNVLVDSNGTVSILDFGLVAEMQTATDQTASLKSAHFAGTPRYASPEQMFGDRSEASDWYALGVMLYESIAGTPPFSGKPLELLHKKQNVEAPLLANKDGLPPGLTDLATLVDQLLKRAPAERPIASDIAQVLSLKLDSTIHGSASSGSVDEDGFEISVADDSDQFLIGRETQLSDLESAKHELLDKREPVVVFISGLSGEGKSSLAEKFLRPLRLGTEMLVLSGRCYDRESVPFKAIDSLIDALVAYLRSRKQAEIESFLPDDIRLLAHLFPLLNRVDSIAAISKDGMANIDSDKLRHRSFIAFRALIGNISAQTPVVILVDDLQWGDSDSAKVLFDAILPPDSPAVMLIGSYRSDEAESSPFLGNWNRLIDKSDHQLNFREINVAPLSREQCTELVSIRTGGDRALIRQRADELFEDTGGNPYFVEQFIEGFNLESGTFKRIPLHDIINGRLNRLPSGASTLLDIISVSGQPISVAEVAQAAGHHAPELATLTRMRSERLVRMIGSENDPFVETYHDKIRESVLEQMTDGKRRVLHQTLGGSIEQNESISVAAILQELEKSPADENLNQKISARVFDLAFHFFAANDERAFVYQLAAGEAAARAAAPQESLEHFQRAESLRSPNCSTMIDYRIWCGVAVAHWLLKHWDQAIDSFERAAAVAPGWREEVLARIGIGRIQARLVKAAENDDLALDLIGRSRPRTLLGKIACFIAGVTRALVVPASWQKSRTKEGAFKANIENAVYQNMMNYAHDFDPMDSPLVVPWSASIAANRMGNVTLSNMFIAQGLSGVGLTGLSRKYLNRASRVADTLQDRELQAMNKYFESIVLWCTSELKQVDNCARCAENLLRKVGFFGQQSSTIYFSAEAQRWIGPSGSMRETAQKAVELAGELDGIREQVAGSLLVALASARSGDLEAAQSKIAATRQLLPDCPYLTLDVIRLQICGFVGMQCSDYAAAADHCSRGWKSTRQHKSYNPMTLPVLFYCLESIAGPDWHQKFGQKDAELRSLCRQASIWQLVFKHMRPLALRTRGRALWVLSRRKKSIRCLRKSVQISRTLDQKYDLAKSLLDLAAVQEESREESRREAIELLNKMESVIPRAESWLLGDQYDEAVVAPEFDLEAWEREHGHVSSPKEVDA